MKRSRLFLRLGAWGFLLTFVAHTLGQMEGLPAPANETERQLFDLMTGYRRGPGGFERSTLDFVNGFSISMSAFCLFGALLAFVVARSKDDGVVRAAAVVYAAWAAAGGLEILTGREPGDRPTCVCR